MWLPAGPWAYTSPLIAPGTTLIPHPEYPGYGYAPSNPTQLYPLPRSAAVLDPGPSVGVSAGPASGETRGATETPAKVPVVIVNAAGSGTAIDYVIDGVTYKIESGEQQRLAVNPRSAILYDRGGDLGEQRYALSAGVYEFRSSDAGRALFKLRPTLPEDATRPLSVPVPKNDLPAMTGTPVTTNSRSGSDPSEPRKP